MDYYIIETNRLILRPMSIEDAEALHNLLDKDERMWRYQHGYAYTFEDRINAIKARLEHYDTYGFGCFAVVRKSDGQLIGQCGLSPHEFEEKDGRTTQVFEVMFAIGMPFQGQGYATEAASAWVRYAFETAKLERLVVCPLKENIASIRVLEKLGFRIEDDWLEPESVIAYLERSNYKSA